MERNGDVIYTYDGTLDGFLACVFEAFEKKEHPILIAKREAVQLTLGAEVRAIEPNAENAERVYNGIKEKLGSRALTLVYHATLSSDEDAEAAALRYLRLAFKAGRAVYSDLTDDRVLRMNKISREIEREAGRYLEFIRFSELEGNVLFAEFEPEPHVLPIIMPHFADRLRSQPFIIHDIGRALAGVYDTKEWYLISSATMSLPKLSENELEYRELWKLFYNTIAIKERINPRRQMQFLPKKYWNHLTEMQ